LVYPAEQKLGCRAPPWSDLAHVLVDCRGAGGAAAGGDDVQTLLRYASDSDRALSGEVVRDGPQAIQRLSKSPSGPHWCRRRNGAGHELDIVHVGFTGRGQVDVNRGRRGRSSHDIMPQRSCRTTTGKLFDRSSAGAVIGDDDPTAWCWHLVGGRPPGQHAVVGLMVMPAGAPEARLNASWLAGCPHPRRCGQRQPLRAVMTWSAICDNTGGWLTSLTLTLK